jgi:hypothetical protein
MGAFANSLANGQENGSAGSIFLSILFCLTINSFDKRLIPHLEIKMGFFKFLKTKSRSSFNTKNKRISSK